MTDLAPAPAARLPWLDLWRGGAVVAIVVIYHFAWDLSHLGFIATDVSRHPLWALFARSIAFSFLTIAGLALVPVASARHALALLLAPDRHSRRGGAGHHGGDDGRHAGKLRRLRHPPRHRRGKRAGVALPPSAMVRRGRWRDRVLAIRQAAFLPGFVAWQQEAIGGWPFRILQHLGLTAIPPEAVDFVPIVPWFAATLVGVALGKLLLARDGAAPSEPGQRLAALEWLGRSMSLPIYLLHQPVLFGG